MNKADQERDFVSIELSWRLRKRLPKRRPGSEETTQRALAFAAPIRETPRVLDMECGPGRQTLVLAADLGGKVTALDRIPPFLEEVSRRASRRSETNATRTTGRKASRTVTRSSRSCAPAPGRSETSST